MQMLDRERVLNYVKQYADTAPVKKEAEMALRALGVCLCGLPTIDAEPVVRCINCKYLVDDDTDGLWCDKYVHRISFDFFCACGERKEVTSDETD